MGAGREVRCFDETEAMGWHCFEHCATLREVARNEPLLCCVRSTGSATSFNTSTTSGGGTHSGGMQLLLLTDARLVCIAIDQMPIELRWQVRETARAVSLASITSRHWPS